MLRQLQTGSVPTPALLHHMYPETYPTVECQICRKGRANLAHILWECTKHPNASTSKAIQPRLEEAIRTTTMLWAVQQVLEALERHGAREPATASLSP